MFEGYLFIGIFIYMYSSTLLQWPSLGIGLQNPTMSYRQMQKQHDSKKGLKYCTILFMFLRNKYFSEKKILYLHTMMLGSSYQWLALIRKQTLSYGASIKSGTVILQELTVAQLVTTFLFSQNLPRYIHNNPVLRHMTTVTTILSFLILSSLLHLCPVVSTLKHSVRSSDLCHTCYLSSPLYPPIFWLTVVC